MGKRVFQQIALYPKTGVMRPPGSSRCAFLEQLRQELDQHPYRPLRVRTVGIPKANGGTRQLWIPAIRDRVVQGESFKPNDIAFRRTVELQSRRSLAGCITNLWLEKIEA